RGRVYCQGGELNSQGSELARSLLLFKKGNVLSENGLNSLKVYGANAFGLNKLSITKRLEWVDQHFSEILDLNPGLSRKADEPMLFLAFYFELQGYNKDPLNFIFRLPIYLDATCNGVQHLAAMVSDFDLASKVN
ncbi:hypothetical protein BDB00DRAFT_730356, partial [Zychaea mexicana]|uniref:uncharacterized protein n=1 Tax=Zychaea mexicana TaxID=64656 RepID=UPI0022FEA733